MEVKIYKDTCRHSQQWGRDSTASQSTQGNTNFTSSHASTTGILNNMVNLAKMSQKILGSIQLYQQGNNRVSAIILQLQLKPKTEAVYYLSRIIHVSHILHSHLSGLQAYIFLLLDLRQELEYRLHFSRLNGIMVSVFLAITIPLNNSF